MADQRRTRTKRETTPSKKDVKPAVAKERKTSQTRETKTKPSPVTSQTRSSSNQRAGTEVAGTSKRKEPLISGNKPSNIVGKEVKNVQRSLARKVTLPEPPRVKMVTGSSGVTLRKSSEKTKIAAVSAEKKGKVMIKSEAASSSKNESSSSSLVPQSSSSSSVPQSSSRLSRDRTRTRTISPSRSKLVHVVPTQDISDTGHFSPASEDCYESDFESDFESCSSDESSSVSSEMAGDDDKPSDGPADIASIQLAAEKTPPKVITPAPVTSQMSSVGPAGMLREKIFVPSLSAEQRVTPRQSSTSSTNVRVSGGVRGECPSDVQSSSIDFATARQRQIRRHAARQATRRGTELLSMLRLDEVNFTLLHVPPCHYLDLMTRLSVGTQAQTQTGEVRLEESTQSEGVISCERWTQHPACLDREVLQSSGPSPKSPVTSWPKLDLTRLEKFVDYAAQMVLAVLGEVNTTQSSLTSLGLGSSLQEVTEEGTSLGVEVTTLLRGRPATLLDFSDRSRLLTVHPPQDDNPDPVLRQNLVLVWWTAVPECPRHVLGPRGIVKSLCVHQEWSSLVFAATTDGSLLMWDLQEEKYHHPSTSIEGRTYNVRTPTFTSALVPGSHRHVMVKLAPLSGGQLLSVDEAGLMVTWSVLKLTSGDLGAQSAWGKYQLVLSSTRNISGAADSLVTDARTLGDRVLLTFDCGSVTIVSTLQPDKTNSLLKLQGTTQGHCRIDVSPNNGHKFVVLDSAGTARVYRLPSCRLVYTCEGVVDTCWDTCGLLLLLSSRKHVRLFKQGHVSQDTWTFDKMVANMTAANNQIAISDTEGSLLVISLKSTVLSKSCIVVGG